MRIQLYSRFLIKPCLLLLLLAFGARAVWAGNLFSGPINSPAARYPFALAAGDFNKDGNADVAVTNNNPANTGHDQVKVLLGNGNGTFQKPTGYGVGQEPLSVAVGDFNGDGKLDLAVANHREPQGPGKVSVLLGNGDGTFQKQVTYRVGQGPDRVAVADFNGDGKLDLAVTGARKTIHVFLGNGDGTFQPPMKSPVVHHPNFIVVGDLNGDGKPDLVVASTAPSYVTTALLGNGDGTFRTAWTTSNRMGPFGIALGDFNGDGKLDMAECYSDPSRLTIRLGNGDGTFRDGAHYMFGDGLGPLAAGDFDGDGKLDLAVVNIQGVTVLLGKGDGTFLTEGSYPLNSGGSPVEMITADVNNDGKPDLVFTDVGNGVVGVLLNTGKR